SALAQFGDRLSRRIHDHHAGRERGAAPRRNTVEAERVGIGHDGADLVDRDAEFLRRHHADRDARARDIAGAEDQRHRAVDRDVERAGGLATAVEPEARRDAAALAGWQRRIVMVAGLGSLQRLDEADRPESLAIDGLVAFGRCVLEAEVDRVHADLAGQLVEYAFDPEHHLRHTGRAERVHLRPVRHDLIRHRLHVLEVVAREHRLRCIDEHRAGEAAGLEDELGVGGRDGAVLLGSELDARLRPRYRPGGAEHLVAGERDLDRPLGLAGELDRHWLAVEAGLAAETAAHLRLLNADLGGFDLENVGEPVAEHPWRLRAAPQFDLAVLAAGRDAALRLDIALVHRLGVVFVLDDDVGLLEARLGVAHGEVEPLAHVRGLVAPLDSPRPYL